MIKSHCTIEFPDFTKDEPVQTIIRAVFLMGPTIPDAPRLCHLFEPFTECFVHVIPRGPGNEFKEWQNKVYLPLTSTGSLSLEFRAGSAFYSMTLRESRNLLRNKTGQPHFQGPLGSQSPLK